MCDTFVALPAVTGDGSVIFGKNSDREPNEAQSFEYHPPAIHPAGSTVRCTWVTIPQAPSTYGILIGRPFWMWGAEMGANEKGVVIGNEAVFTRQPMSKSGLTGMDLLRLALERAATAQAALEVIVGLLADHGQGGGAGYENPNFFYHNGFILADPRQAWVLETAGPWWAAREIRESYTLSNLLTIGVEHDLLHPGLIETARKNGWLKKNGNLNFAQIFSNRFMTTMAGGRPRRGRMSSFLEGMRGHFGPSAAMALLRDHGQEDYQPDGHWILDRVCAHAANGLTRNAAQTTGSLVAHLTPDQWTFWATGTAAPCLSLFLPARFEGPVWLDPGPPPGSSYDPAARWWRHELLHRSVLQDFQARRALIGPELTALQDECLGLAAAAPPGHLTEAAQRAWDRMEGAEAAWLEAIRSKPVEKRSGWFYDRYWRARNRKARLPLD